MESAQTTKKKLVLEIEQLTNPYLMELQDFIQYLKYKQSNKAIQSNDQLLVPPEQDPIFHAIGLVNVAPFSDMIDDALYGTI